jgi:dihydropyrimidinase
VELCCANPAKLLGLYPRKGTIVPGGEADIVVWDPEATHTIRAATQHQRTGYNLYEGMAVTGVPSVVLSRGQVLVRERFGATKL